MAQSLRRPLFSAVGLSPSFSRRCFSQLPALRASPQAPQPSRPRQRADRSIRVISKEMQAIPSDLGLLEMTFINPTGNNRPSLSSTPLAHLKYQWKRFVYRFRDLFSLIVFKISSPRDKTWYKRAVKLSRSTLTPMAVALHRQMYTSFAEGDAVTLRKICTDGLYDSFRARIGNRPRGEKVVWELVNYNKRSKLVSYRGARLPIAGAGVMQAVVRIASRQKLTRLVQGKSGGMQVVPGSGKEKDVVEYVVLQRQYEGWREGEWQLWGTTKETTMEDIEEWERRALE